MKMDSWQLKHYAEMTRNADEWYRIWGRATDLEQIDLAEHCKWELENLIKELDRIGDCNHKYRGINC